VDILVNNPDVVQTAKSGTDEQSEFTNTRKKIDKLKQVHRGWPVYCRMAGIQSKLRELDGTLERLYKRGYKEMPGHYTKIAPHLNEPPPDHRAGLYTRTAWFTLSAAEGYSGVRPA
jgi:hypothetical protein